MSAERRMRGASTILNGLMALTCALALVMVGFAHRPVSAYPLQALAAAYQLPDGTYASICFDDDHAGAPHSAKDFECEACRLTSAILVPSQPSVTGLTIAFAHEVKVFERRQRLVRALYPPSSGPRAPPAGSMFA